MGHRYNDMVEQCDVGTMTIWNIGTSLPRYSGTLGRWYNDILEQWDFCTISILEQWYVGTIT